MNPLSTLKKFGLATLICLAQLTQAQEISRELRSFDRIIVSPKINLILEKGDTPAIRLVYARVAPDKINIEVHHKTLRIYLDDAKFLERTERTSRHERGNVYRDAEITAYVTYTDLEKLEIRGNQELTCLGPIDARKFILKAYGENEIELASVRAEYFRTSLYGENKLKVQGGKTEYQKYRLFGENRIDARLLKSFSATTNTYGESRVRLNTQDYLRINAFGESEISYLGDASINRGLIFGQTRIVRGE